MDKLIQFEGTIYEEGYGIVANKVMRSELSLSAKGLYSYLCGYAGHNQKAFPSRVRILSECGISKDTLTKLLKELKEAGYIRIEQERQDKGTFAKNVYYLNSIPCHKIPDTVQPDTVNKDTNINTFINNNINIKEDEPLPKRKKRAGVKAYDTRDSVFLTEEEYNKLCATYDKVYIDNLIDNMSLYIGTYNKKYKNHNLALQKWIKEDKNKPQPKTITTSSNTPKEIIKYVFDPATKTRITIEYALSHNIDYIEAPEA